MDFHTTYISVGSNIGDKLSNCQQGIDALTRLRGTVLMQQSEFFKTEPVDFTDQDWFINTVIQINTDLDPFRLLDEFHAIQCGAGREKDPVRYGPRVLDLDIIFYDDVVMNTAELVIPHPRMHERRFVLRPLCDISPDIIHPVFLKDVKTLLDMLDDQSQQVVRYS